MNHIPMNHIWMRQIGAVLRLEMKKTFLSRRGWWVYFLALGPVALTLLHWLLEISRRRGHHSIGEDSLVFPRCSFLLSRLGISRLSAFFNLFPWRNAGRPRTQLSAPLRPRISVAGKYTSGPGDSDGPVCNQHGDFVSADRPPLWRGYNDYALHGQAAAN
jgi:hypothetical protein